MILMARWMPIADYAALAFTMALTSYFLYVAGLDFYVSAHRELLAGRITLSQVVRAQVAVLGAGLAVATLLLWLLFGPGRGHTQVAIASALLIGEAVCAELSRLLIVIGRPTVANLVNFSKAAGWMIGLLAAGPWIAHQSLLPLSYAAWGIGLLVATALGALSLRMRARDFFVGTPFIGLIRHHLRLMPILVTGTLASRAIFSLDRVFMEWAAGAASLAPYALFAGMGAAFMAFVDTGVVARLYPPLVAAVSRGDRARVRELQRTMVVRTAVLIALLALTLWLGLDLLLRFVGKPEFSNKSYMAWIVSAAYALCALATPAHLVLYGLSRDRLLTAIQLKAASILCAFGALAVVLGQGQWVVWGVLSAFAYMMASTVSASMAALAEMQGVVNG